MQANSLKHPQDDGSKFAGVGWFRAFMKRNTHLSPRKPEGFPRASQKKLNKGVSAAHFKLRATVLQEHDLLNKPHTVHNRNNPGFPLNSLPPKNVRAKGKPQVVTLTNVHRDVNVNIRVVASFNAVGI
jgi:hypothetical protein